MLWHWVSSDVWNFHSAFKMLWTSISSQVGISEYLSFEKNQARTQISQDLLLRVISVSQRGKFWTRKQKTCRILHLGVGIVSVFRMFIVFYSRSILKNHCSTRFPIIRMCAATKYTGLVSDTSATNGNVLRFGRPCIVV